MKEILDKAFPPGPIRTLVLSLYSKAWLWQQEKRGYPHLHFMFQKMMGYPLDISQPKTHNHFLNWIKFHRRDPRVPITSDKVQVRDYIKKMLGEKEGEEILIPLYYVSKTGLDLPFDQWKEEVFIKANHYSGGNILYQPGMNRSKIEHQLRTFLSEPFGYNYHEWAYLQIPRRIICEKVLRTKDGNIPNDVKLYCFHGKVKMIMFVSDRLTQPKRVFTDQYFRVVPGAQMAGHPPLSPVPVPGNMTRMMEIAEKLSQGFDYIRVDLYSVDDEAIYFGEITHYTGSGLEKFDDEDVDYAVGRLWNPANRDRDILDMIEEVKSEKKVAG